PGWRSPAPRRSSAAHQAAAASPSGSAGTPAVADAGWGARARGVSCGAAGVGQLLQQIAQAADGAHAGAAAVQLAAQAMDGDVQPVVGQLLVPVAQRLDQLRATGDAIGA